MRQQELERQLRPALDSDLRGPTRQRFVPQSAEQTTAAERSVADHRHATLATQRQDAFFDTAIIQRIVDLQKIQLLSLEHRLHFFIGRWRVMGDADVTNSPLFLPLAQCRQMGLPVQQVVDLHQVDAIGLQQLERLFHLRDTFFATPGPHLGRQKRRRARLVDRQQFTGRLFGPAVHR
ncbi:hypothetical protein D3C87_1262750 [compost metagenome]